MVCYGDGGPRLRESEDHFSAEIAEHSCYEGVMSAVEYMSRMPLSIDFQIISR